VVVIEALIEALIEEDGVVLVAVALVAVAVVPAAEIRRWDCFEWKRSRRNFRFRLTKRKL
jgi:hypothetical protein